MSDLEGVRVLDLSRYAPGPFCTLILAALGAEVIKVEAEPEGDPLRALDSDAFERLNAGKKSVLLDLKSEKGKARAPAARERRPTSSSRASGPESWRALGVDYESLEKEAPRLVYLSLSGYGGEGPYRNRAGHDINYLASAGALEGALAPARDPGRGLRRRRSLRGGGGSLGAGGTHRRSLPAATSTFRCTTASFR